MILSVRLIAVSNTSLQTADNDTLYQEATAEKIHVYADDLDKGPIKNLESDRGT